VTSPSRISHRLAQGRPGSGSTGRTDGRAATPSRSRTKDWLGTVGWAAKGVLYLLIAGLAFQLAVSRGTEAEQASKQGAMQAVVEKPFGSALLLVIVIGLFAYAAYRAVTVVLPGSGSSDDTGKELGKRVVHAGSAVAYTAFAVQGVALLVGRGGSGGESQQKTWSATLLSSTPGTLLLLAIGAGFVIFAGWQVKRAVSRSFLDKLECPAGSWINRGSAEKIGVTGLVARGVVAALIGVFIGLAVWHHDPDEVRGLDGSLRTLLDAPAGPVVLGAVALGLAAYGLFALVCARCRRHELD
jgi:hypothetical protein